LGRLRLRNHRRRISAGREFCDEVVVSCQLLPGNIQRSGGSGLIGCTSQEARPCGCLLQACAS
jgi:hypothetical protein